MIVVILLSRGTDIVREIAVLHNDDPNLHIHCISVERNIMCNTVCPEFTGLDSLISLKTTVLTGIWKTACSPLMAVPNLHI